MRDCNSLTTVLANLQAGLPVCVPAASEVAIDFDLMHPGANFKTLQQRDGASTERWSKLAGLLFCHPGARLTQAEIIPHLTHFHLRSDLGADFYCMGYGADWPPHHYVDQTVVAKAGEQTWQFSEQAFSEAIDELEQQTRWNYSGECELVLLAAVARPGAPVRLGSTSRASRNVSASTRRSKQS